MLWMTLDTPQPADLYLDIHHMEQNRSEGLCISATLGDGASEGEVLIQVGTREEVTFADMLPDSGLPELLARYGRVPLRDALLKLCQASFGQAGYRWDSPHRNSAQMSLFFHPAPVMSVRETEEKWQVAR